MFSRIYWALGSPLKYCFCRALPLPSELNKWRVSIHRLIQYQSMTNCSKAGRTEAHLHKSWLAVEQQLFWYYIFRLTVPVDLNAFFCIALSPSFWTFFYVWRWNVAQLQRGFCREGPSNPAWTSVCCCALFCALYGSAKGEKCSCT